MDLIKALLLGFIQGATEFLPVSSSGHLVLGSHLLGFSGQSVVFDVMLHLGTLVSVLILFRRDIVQMVCAPWHWLRGHRSEETLHALRWGAAIIVATIPAVVVGFDHEGVRGVAFHLDAGSISDADRHRGDDDSFCPARRPRQQDHLVAGVVDRCRTGLRHRTRPVPFRDHDFHGNAAWDHRETAARFSFLMSLPAILGAAVLHAAEVVATLRRHRTWSPWPPAR